MRLVGLYLALFAFWLLMSGHYEPLIVGFGVLSCAATVYIARRKDFVDYATLSWYVKPRLPLYLALAARPDPEIQPRRREALHPARQPDRPLHVPRSGEPGDQRRASRPYANSITLTPGHRLLQTWDHEIRVHALTRHGARDILGGAMDGRICRVEGPSKTGNGGGP